MGRYTASLVFTLLPLPFYAIERIRRHTGNRRLQAVAGAVSIALLSFSHPGYAFWSLVFISLYLVILASCGPSRSTFPVRELAAMMGLGIALSAYLVLPMWIEQQWTGLGVGFSMATQGKPSWGQLLSWSNYRARFLGIPEGHNHWFGGYVGLSLVGLALAGYVSRSRRLRFSIPRDFAVIGLAISLLIMFGYEWPLVRDIGIVQAMGAARYLVFTVFFLAVLSGVAIQTLRARWRYRPACYAGLLLLILIDLGPSTFLQPYNFLPDPEAVTMEESLYTTLTENGTEVGPQTFAPSRHYHTSKPVNSYLSMISRTPSVFGLFEEHPRADKEFVRPFLSGLHEPLGGDREEVAAYLDSDSGRTAMDGLRLLNTRQYVESKSNVPTVHLVVDKASPIVVSKRLEPIHSDDSDPLRMIERMGLDPVNPHCRAILVGEGVPPGELPGVASIDRISHVVRVGSASITCRVSADAFCRLTYGYYPNLDLRLDGEPTDYFRTADGFIGLQLPEGTHEILITGRLSGLRVGILWFDIILLVAAVYWARHSSWDASSQEDT